MYDHNGAITWGKIAQFGSYNRKEALDFSVLRQFRGQMCMTFLVKNCRKLQNFQGSREAEVRQLGVLQWHQKLGIICQLVILEEKNSFKHSSWSKYAGKSRKTQFWNTILALF